MEQNLEDFSRKNRTEKVIANISVDKDTDHANRKWLLQFKNPEEQIAR